MAVLAQQSDLSAAQVAERTAMDKVAVSRAVSRLLARGRLERRTAPADRRKSMLSLSNEGRNIYAEVVPVALRLERSLLAVLGEADRQALERILDTLLEHARTFGKHS
jgi:DNA-binding MarR family transcriptional regulator